MSSMSKKPYPKNGKPSYIEKPVYIYVPLEKELIKYKLDSNCKIINKETIEMVNWGNNEIDFGITHDTNDETYSNNDVNNIMFANSNESNFVDCFFDITKSITYNELGL